MKYIRKVYESDILSGGIVKLYHYSNELITDYIRVNRMPNLHSTNEFRIWGKARTFFYVKVGGYTKDSMPNLKYMYICHIPADKIYNFSDNPKNYTGTLSEIYLQSSADGYTAWLYNSENPIVTSFVNVKVYKSYKRSPGGKWVKMDWKGDDIVVGAIKIKDRVYDVYQLDGYPISVNNLYYKPESDNTNYKKAIYTYMLNDIIQ